MSAPVYLSTIVRVWPTSAPNGGARRLVRWHDPATGTSHQKTVGLDYSARDYGYPQAVVDVMPEGATLVELDRTGSEARTYRVTWPAVPTPPHVPYGSEPVDPTYVHDWADGQCQHPDCAAHL